MNHRVSLFVRKWCQTRRNVFQHFHKDTTQTAEHHMTEFSFILGTYKKFRTCQHRLYQYPRHFGNLHHTFKFKRQMLFSFYIKHYATDVGFMNRPHNLCHHGETCTTGKGQYFVFIRRHKFFNDRNTGSMKQRLHIMRLDIPVFGNRIYNTANTRHIHTKEFDLIGSRAGSIHDT